MTVLKQEEYLKPLAASRLDEMAKEIETSPRVASQTLRVMAGGLRDLLPATPAKTSQLVPRLQRVIDTLAAQRTRLLATPPQRNPEVVSRVVDLLPSFVY